MQPLKEWNLLQQTVLSPDHSIVSWLIKDHYTEQKVQDIKIIPWRKLPLQQYL